MHTEVITNWQGLSHLEKEWNQLLSVSSSNAIFLTWEWIQAWRKVVGEEKLLFVVIARDNQGRLVGIAPFYHYNMRLFDRINFKALRILADYATGFEYADWIVHPDCEEGALVAISQELRRNSKEWDLIWMPRMSGWSGARERLEKAFAETGLLHHSRPSLFSALPLPDTLIGFEESFSGKRRQQLRRHRRKLTSTEGVAVRHCQSQEELPEFIENLFNLHHQRRMLLGDPGCFVRKPAEAEFYRHFLPSALDRGWLRLVALTHDDKIQAIQIGYAYNGVFLQLQEGFNPDYTNGAGNVLRHIVIDESIQEGLTTYDFLGGFTEHKRRWGAQERAGYDFLIGHPSLKNRLFFTKDIWPSGKYIQEQGLYDGN